MANLDLAGIITRICTDLRAKFSKVTVTRNLTSGTKSATVTVDGVKYDLYAPSQPSASITAPLMDGTAAVGTATTYARADHVHPTDSSKQDALVSGTNIKTINGDSILGSGDLTVGGAGSQTTWFGTGATATTIDGVKCVPVSSSGWTFSAGNILVVMMSSANLTITTQVVALSVNGSAPVSIARDGAVLSAANEKPRNTFVWDDQEVVTFVYDGEYFQVCSRSLGDINVVAATCNADGTDRFLDMQMMVGIRENDFTKRNNLFVVRMTTDGTTANYTGTDPLLLRYEGATTTTSGLAILKNGHSIVGSNNELSWVAGEFLLFARDTLSMSPFFVAKSNPTPKVVAEYTSGTLIATIDGVPIYSSGGGSGPEPSSTTPAMDGTAAVGTATTYARADHVHPTDTSRQPTLVSGTNIKTVNGTSILGSGNISTAELPTVTASDNGKVLQVVSGAWAAASLPSANGVSF